MPSDRPTHRGRGGGEGREGGWREWEGGDRKQVEGDDSRGATVEKPTPPWHCGTVGLALRHQLRGFNLRFLSVPRSSIEFLLFSRLFVIVIFGSIIRRSIFSYIDDSSSYSRSSSSSNRFQQYVNGDGNSLEKLYNCK